MYVYRKYIINNYEGNQKKVNNEISMNTVLINSIIKGN